MVKIFKNTLIIIALVLLLGFIIAATTPQADYDFRWRYGIFNVSKLTVTNITVTNIVATNITSGNISVNNLVSPNNISSAGLILPNTNHTIYDNSTCMILTGDTSTLYIC
jgi:hypothetical protein